MLCSISTQKSGANWLDRLRSSKGFSFADHHTPNGSNSNSSHAETQLRDSSNNNAGSESSSDPIRSGNEPVQTPTAPGNRGDDEQLCNVVTNVLSELFCMGESTSFPKFNFKKGSRKQTNPRFCASSEINNAASPMSDENSRVEIKDSKVKLLEQGHDLNLVGEEDKSQANLLGFSRTEVMVIDTSCAPWKFEKLLFRKKNAWKVRDKKSKTTSVGNKKRKKADVVNEDVNGEKKQKVVSGKDGCGSSKDEKGGVCKFPVNEIWLNDELEETCRRTSDTVGQASKKKQGNLKLKKASSSVVLIKSIPTSKKNGTGAAKNCLKPSHRQYQAQ
ncbi:uncharacterized protein LOC107780649 isoform X2 [Nicotiana tabacum]|uniref:Uncharacterized protein LOC107780649 isoform X2 n=1 Tax=Nicotiana tabacum TaxID=4097 RepID=A0A1S3YXX7_TOBAC|nr:uncharacterized protein LOC104099337 isoform X2 [Nicotiana tomentosiformis]XP_016456697.1 PREDICTED: uncharacterized protein LOC107780649 isoform X2 [Nicotiana tabacum]